MSDLWSEASRDVEAENHLRALTAAKLDSKGVWKFLALSQSQEEYEHRKELALTSLFTTARAHGLQLNDLTSQYDSQFKLFMEAKDFTVEIKDDDPDDKGKFGNSDDAPKSDDDSDNDDSDEDGDDSDDDKGNPFGKSDDDSDDGDDKGDKTPVTTKPHQKPSESAVPGDDDGGNGAPDDGSDDDDDSDSDKDDDDKDSSDDSDDNSPPWAKKSSKYSSLLSRIEAGEDPLSWGRKVADAGDGDMGDPGQGNDDGAGAPGAGMSSAPSSPSASTAPSGPTTDTAPAMGGGSGDGGASSTNGGNQPMMSASSSRKAAMIEDIGIHNPHLPFGEIKRLADLALKVADGGDPLTYGDRGGVADGPVTNAVKSAAPPDPTGSIPDQQPGGGGDDSDDGSGGGSGGGGSSGGGGGGLGGAAIGTAVKMLPDLLMAARRDFA